MALRRDPTPGARAARPDDATGAAVDLYWLPLGAGGSFVRFNGRVYEALVALLERRTPLALYHCALEVRVDGTRFTIELTPVPDGDGAARGVAREGPVGSRLLERFRLFRYEVRCWRDGVIPDADLAVASPLRLSDDPRVARRLLRAVASVPAAVWGRDELRAGEMWNCNSVVSWLLARSGVPLALAALPPGGRAPGWDAGIVVARRQERAEAAHRRPHDTSGLHAGVG